MNILIKRVKPDEAVILSKLSKQTFYDTFTGTCTEADMENFLEEYFNLTQVEKELSDNADFFYFAEVDGKPVGYIRFKEDYEALDTMSKWKALELKRLYVLKEYQGKGIADLLMEYVMNYATENHFEVVWLGVWEFNFRAQRFYQKKGFEDSGFSHSFPIGSTPQTDLWYWKFI